MYDKCYFCLDQLPKLKKRIHSKLFRKFWRSRGTKEPAYITVMKNVKAIIIADPILILLENRGQLSLHHQSPQASAALSPICNTLYKKNIRCC